VLKRTPSVTVWGPMTRLGPKTAFIGVWGWGAVSSESKQGQSQLVRWVLSIKVMSRERAASVDTH
jgi:hypothetical protein